MQRILQGVRLLSKLLSYITKRYMRKGYNVMGTATQRNEKLRKRENATLTAQVRSPGF